MRFLKPPAFSLHGFFIVYTYDLEMELVCNCHKVCVREIASRSAQLSGLIWAEMNTSSIVLALFIYAPQS